MNSVVVDAFASDKPSSPINHLDTFDVPGSYYRTIQEYVGAKSC